MFTLIALGPNLDILPDNERVKYAGQNQSSQNITGQCSSGKPKFFFGIIIDDFCPAKPNSRPDYNKPAQPAPVSPNPSKPAEADEISKKNEIIRLLLAVIKLLTGNGKGNDIQSLVKSDKQNKPEDSIALGEGDKVLA